MKQFLVLFFAALFFSHAIAQTGNEFRSESMGFSVTKPDGWHFVSAQENLDNIRRTEMEDEEFQKLVLQYATAPMVAMMRYKEPYDDLNPSFKVNVRPFGQLDPNDPKKIIELVLPQMKAAFSDFKVEVPPTEATVSGINSAYTQISYSLRIPDGRIFPTTSELWIVPHGSYFFMVGAGTRTDERTGTRGQIAEILATIEIDD